MSKRLLLSISFLVTVFFGITLFYNASKSKAAAKSIDPAFKDYVSAFTSGFISNESSIRIVLKQNPDTMESMDANELIQFQPEIKGKAVWINNNILEFKPDENLPHDATYKATFLLGKVLDVPSDLKSFEFEFSTIPQALEAEITSVQCEKSNATSYTVQGVLNFADAEGNETAEKCLIAIFNEKNLPVEWIHDSPVEHRFIVREINRGTKESSLKLVWNGEACRSNATGQVELLIPSLNDFKPLLAKTNNESEQNVVLFFSDPIENKSNAESYFHLENEEFSMTFNANEVRLYPSARISGNKMLVVKEGLQSYNGKTQAVPFNFQIAFEDLKPALRLSAKGNIIPPGNSFLFPFEAVNLNAIDVKITKIYENNILQFLQVNQLSGNAELARVGKQIVKKKIALSSLGSNARNKWNTFYLDLSQIMQTEPGAIYNVSLNFKPHYSTYACNSDSVSFNTSEIEDEENEPEKDWDYYSYYYDNEYEYYYDDYDYRERENPCSKSYYGPSRRVHKNVMSGNIGLLVKKTNNGQLMIYTSAISDAKALAGVTIECYDYQQQLLQSTETGSDGIVFMQIDRKPFVVIAKKGTDKVYLKLDDGASNSLSMFDVDGEVVQKGIKGFIYGERGVWRPGDTLFLSFMMESANKEIPANFPVSLELHSPSGQSVFKTTNNKNVGGLYTFPVSTDPYAPTGIYTCIVRSGGVNFSKSLRVESIMPNRLKINLNFNKEVILASDGIVRADLQVNWLHGAPARALETKMDLTLNKTKTAFKNYKDFIFDNPASSFYSEPSEFFAGTTNENGFIAIQQNLASLKNAPGFLSASFTTRVFEPGGAFSTDRFTIPLSPFSFYVGIRSPEPNKNTSYLETDTDHKIEVVSLDENGKLADRKVKIKVYKVSWRWWWDNYNDDLSSYATSEYHQPVLEKEIYTKNGKADFDFRINQPDWGRFLILAEDEDGHTTGDVIYLDWPSWAGKSPKGNEGANYLNFNSDKTEYSVGEKVNLIIPGSEGAKAFITIENGSSILKTFTLDMKAGDNNFSFETDESMTPNIYVYATIIQPHANTKNDLPIRLYGVLSLSIKDQNTILNPSINCEAVWRPETNVKVKVSEKSGKKMAYTLAIVDEGLLDLTRFKTPDPWSVFFAKEALGVKTWDVYDFVMNALAAGIQRILSIGGDGEVDSKNGSNAQRFKPMVRFIGPFQLEKNESNEHVINIPQYVGSVRVMVVASGNKAYGYSEKTVPVRKPLMILSALPRVLGPGEEVNLPVTVFAMEKNVKNVNLSVNTDKFLSIKDDHRKAISFTDIGDQVVYFKLKVGDRVGVSKVKISASSGNETANEEIEIEIRPSNPVSSDVASFQTESNKVLSLPYIPYGLYGTNKASIEISSMPSLNLKKRLRYLIAYPHGCVEQTTSTAFAQLYLSKIIELDDVQKKQIEKNIQLAIKRLGSFTTPSGGLSYWPGLNTADEWGTNYAFHFLSEANSIGYNVPSGMMQGMKKYLKEKSRQWKAAAQSARYQEDLIQAYRLYVLALSGSPDLGSMNKLKEVNSISVMAQWRLAAAYALSGKKEVAKALIHKSPSKTPYYSYSWYSYGSSFRDDAMMLETLVLLNEKTKAFMKVKELAEVFSSNEWLSTQSTAFGILSVCKFAEKNEVGKGLNFELMADKKIKVSKKSPVYIYDISNAEKKFSFSLKNLSGGLLFVRLLREGIPATGNETDDNHDLIMNVFYTDRNNNPINVENLAQGTDFYAFVTVSNPGFRDIQRNLALTQIFPPGWEILNDRMDEVNVHSEKLSIPSYRDIRDDRVLSYFDLAPGSSKTFRVRLNAAYIGKYYLPGSACEAMYDNSVYARKAGKWVNVSGDSDKAL